ncbi:MAG: sulfur carrier protein ThiS [Verrucomicrobiota bacterium]|jgi:thiamine biosynthesis protein ThiS|nr:sulfur carrier protein ThiS [Verrucomicrobiota bacterium]
MTVMINGQPAETSAEVVADFVKEHIGGAARVAVVVNDRVVPSAELAATRLNGGDRVELLTFACGG